MDITPSKEDFQNAFNNVDKRWRTILIKEISEPKLSSILTKLSLADICPEFVNIFNAFRLTSFDDTKFIIIGEEPDSTFANDGFALSNPNNLISPTLSNLYERMCAYNVLQRKPHSGDLRTWATDGVLLLNMALTSSHCVDHRELWNTYIMRLIEHVAELKKQSNEILTFIVCADVNLDHISDSHHVIYPISPTGSDDDSDAANVAKASIVETIPWDVVDWNSILNLSAKYYLREESNDENIPRIFIDGSSTVHKENNEGGWALFIYDDNTNDVIYGKTSDVNGLCNVTNNRSELTALLNALKHIIEHFSKTPVEIVSDSKYCIGMITKWIFSWYKIDKSLNTKNNGERVQNSDIVRQIFRTISELKNVVHVRHVNSHKTAPRNNASFEYVLWYGNFVADHFAGKGRKIKTLEIQYTTDDEISTESA